MRLSRLLAAAVLPLLACLTAGVAAPADRYFVIQVVDDRTGRGVPLVELRTVNEIRYYTDSAGIAAIDEPGLNGQQAFFHVKSHGYEFPADGFGIRGVALKAETGKTATVKIHRNNIAERLYRITGEGVYRDTVLTGRTPPVKQPLLNAQVLGSDSVQNAVYKGRMFWMWGDTLQAAYPLGNYSMSGATSALPGKGGLDLDRGVDLDYFTGDNGFARGMAPISGEGPTWLGGLVVLKEDGKERLYAGYVKIKNQLEVYERGLCLYNDARGEFERVVKFPLDAPATPTGHTAIRSDKGVDYVYFGDPFPTVRVRAEPEALRDISRYESYTCLKEGSRIKAPTFDRDGSGKLRYAWRRNTPPLDPEAQDRLAREGKLDREQTLARVRDVETGKPVAIHRGTVNWNPYRKRWIMIATEIGGTSMLGEVWFSEAESPLGPWINARKIVTHESYSFYNPSHHVEFDQDGGRLIYFEGTYTYTFSGTQPTPRYDYNQMMYRLDLSDPRLDLKPRPGK